MTMAKSKSGNPIEAMYEKHRGAKKENAPDGKYVVQWRNLTLKNGPDEEKPSATLTGVIQRGEMKGKAVSKYTAFYDRETKNGVMSGEEDFVRFMEMMYLLGVDTTEVKLKDIPTVIKEEKPVTSVSIKNNGDFQNISILELIEDEDGDEDEDEEIEEDEEEEEEEEVEVKPKKAAKPAPKTTKKPPVVEEEEEEEEEDEDEEEEEEEETVEPTKGMVVLYKAKGKKTAQAHTVQAVNKKARTATLAHTATGAKSENVSWDDFEVSEDEDD